jgi:4-azaleucine resistance transporter AzlC
MPGMPSTGDIGTAPARRTHASGFRRGLKAGLPIFLGYVPVGTAFGILARQLGFTVADAVICSATALAGAGQFIALSLLGGGATAAATIAATAVVNMRYLLFATTLAPHLRGASGAARSWLAFSLTDETFAVNLAERRAGRADVASMAGVGVIAWCGWVLGTTIGAVGSGLVRDPSTWGVDFAMPAMFAALFVALAEDRRHVIVGLIGAVAVLALPLLSEFGLVIDRAWFIVIASLVATTVGWAVFRGR